MLRLQTVVAKGIVLYEGPDSHPLRANGPSAVAYPLRLDKIVLDVCPPAQLINSSGWDVRLAAGCGCGQSRSGWTLV